MSLTDAAVRKGKPTEKPTKLFDGRGMFLLMSARLSVKLTGMRKSVKLLRCAFP